MKIFCCEVGEKPQFYVKTETAQIRNNEPLYIPFFCKELCYEFAFAVKINRVTKAISENFAHRCWNEYSLVVNFWSEDLARKQRSDGQWADIAYSFDRSFALENDFHQLGCVDNISAAACVNGLLVREFEWSEVSENISRVIAYISSYITLKIGDVVMIKSTNEIYRASIGDRIEVKMDNEIILETIIK